MDELEHKLRSALTEMAEGVPPSHHAWAEQERRLALKSRRNRLRPALMAAVAAAVVALIAVPVVVLNSRTAAPVGMGAGVMPPETRSSAGVFLPDGRKQIPYRPDEGETLLAGPMIVGSKGMSSNRQVINIYVYAVRSMKGHLVCVAENVDGNEINGIEQPDYGVPNCAPITKPRVGYSWGYREVSGAGNGGGTYVYVMSQPADRLFLRDVNERLLVAQQKAAGDEFVMFAAYLDSQQPAKAWTVRDAADKVLQNGP